MLLGTTVANDDDDTKQQPLRIFNDATMMKTASIPRARTRIGLAYKKITFELIRQV
jgi:hypothetical protein